MIKIFNTCLASFLFLENIETEIIKDFGYDIPLNQLILWTKSFIIK